MSKPVNFGQISPARRWALLICLLLVTIAIAAQALHSHPDEFSAEARHCTICQVAHAPVLVASAAPLAVVLTTTAFLTLQADPDPKQGLDSFSLFCRPPPAV